MAETLGLAVNCMAVVDLAAKLATTLYTYGKEVSGARDEINRLREQVGRLGEVTRSVHGLLERHGEASRNLRTFQLIEDGVFETETNFVRLSQDLDISGTRRSMRRFGFRALKWPFSQSEVASILSSLEDCFQTLSQSLQVDQTSVLLDVDRRQLLESLPHAEDAAFDSRVEHNNPTCHPRTRYGILSDIYQWAEDPEGKNIFWLNGMAGTGKSTISRTVSSHFSQRDSLAASFFFKRGESNRGNCTRFFSTVAVQLALREPGYAAGLRSSLTEDPSLASKSLREQCNKLVIEPLSGIPPGRRKVKTLIMVVDALDECDNDNDIRLLIHLLSGASWDPAPWRLKTFITSRPELPIRLGFGAVEGTFQDLILHEVSADVVESDIRVYLEDELAKIKGDFNLSVPAHRQLDDSWPNHNSITTLSEMAVPLFIFAATVCRFVADRKAGTPEKQLQRFLDYKSSERASSKLGAIYLPILEQTVSGLSENTREEALVDFRLVVGTIVLLYEAIPAGSLGTIINCSVKQIEERLDLLHSVLNVPSSPEKPIRLLHLSFRDFLTDEKNENGNHAFWVDQQRGHEVIAHGCISIMERLLRKDIKQTNLIYQPDDEENEGDEKSQNETPLPEELKYACKWWIQHLVEARVRLRDADRIHNFIDKHFLHWTEAVCVPDIKADVLGLWRSLGPLIDEHEAPQLHAFHADAIRVLSANVHLINSTPMSAYSSMLIFSPTNSIVRGRYAEEIPDWITIGRRVHADWDPVEMTFDYEQIHGRIHTLAISPNNTFLILVSLTGYCQVRDIASGRFCFTASAPSTNKVAFSYDSKFVVLAGPGELHICVSATGQVIESFYIHGLWTMSIDSPHLAFMTESGEIRILEAGPGPAGIRFNDVFTVRTGPLPVVWLNLRRDDLTLATEYRNHEVEIWRAHLPASTAGPTFNTSNSFAMPERVCTITTPESIYRNKYAGVILSPNSSHLALLLPGATLASRIEIYRLDSREQMYVFESGHSFQTAVVFSPASQVIARDSGLGVVNVRDMASGSTLAQLNRRGTTALAFSEDLSLVAMSFSRSVQIWNFAGMKSQMAPPSIYSGGGYNSNNNQELSRATKPITWIGIAPDLSIVVVGTGSGELQIWDPVTYTRTMTMEGHTGSVLFGIFSDDMERLITFSVSELRVWNLNDGTFRCQSAMDEDVIGDLHAKYRETKYILHLHFIKGLLTFNSFITVAPECRCLDYGIYDGYGLVVGDLEFHLESGYLAAKNEYAASVCTSLWHSVGYHWIRIMDLPLTYKDKYRRTKISRDGRYLIILSSMVSIEVWSLTTYQKLGSFNHVLQQLKTSVWMEILEGTDMSFGCECPSFSGTYSNRKQEHLNIGIHICSCRDAASSEFQGLARVSFYYGTPKGLIHLIPGLNIVEFMGKDVMSLPNAQQAKMVQGWRCFDEQFHLLAIGTESEEVLFLSIEKGR